MKSVIRLVLKFAEIILLPLTLVTAAWTRVIIAMGLHRTVFAKRIFLSFGFLPVRDHYYQPLINPAKHLHKPLDQERSLPGINFNDNVQLALLGQFKVNHELESFPFEKNDNAPFHYNNESYVSGDAEYLYNIIRHFKPKQIIEIGSGMSTKIALEALKRNTAEGTSAQITCVEPYEQPWLEQTSAKIIRKKVEDIDKAMFAKLQENDILFIDSSHIIRPQGDVLYEFLELLPIIKKGVIVHVHDIFTPRDYPADWIINENRLWNEQYLLEAFLSNNRDFEIIGALNYLAHNHHDAFAAKCPSFASVGGEPGGFWMRKII